MTDEERIKWLRHEIFRLIDLGEDTFKLKQELLVLEMKNDNKQ